MAPLNKSETKDGKPTRSYLGWSDADMVEWKVQKETEGRKNWKNRWGPGNRWWNRYEKWICSDIRRAMRKPSFRSLEWMIYDSKVKDNEDRTDCNITKVVGQEGIQSGERRTRFRNNIKEYFVEPLEIYKCCPHPSWPVTTYGEIGWLAKQKCCQLEIYPNDFMKKPALPWYMPKISSFLANSQ